MRLRYGSKMKFVLRRDPSYKPGESEDDYGLWDMWWGRRLPHGDPFETTRHLFRQFASTYRTS